MGEVCYREKINDTSCKYKVFGAQYRMGRDSSHDDVCGTVLVIYIFSNILAIRRYHIL
jgi:hypothetical protein